MDRKKIKDELREGKKDVLIGGNLLREGHDQKEGSLVDIIDDDKEGFLSSKSSLTQTAGRAARNLNGQVIMYADKITDSMQKTIDETSRRRSLQLAYNEEHGITPQAIVKARNLIIGQEKSADDNRKSITARAEKSHNQYKSPALEEIIENEFRRDTDIAADPVIKYMTPKDIKRAIDRLRADMVEAAKKMEFIEAAQMRDELLKMEALLEKTEG